MLLVNCGPQQHDPIWELIRRNRRTDDPSPNGESALKAIREWVDKRTSSPPWRLSLEEISEAILLSIQKGTFGSGQGDNAHAMWNPPLVSGEGAQTRPGELMRAEALVGRSHPIEKLSAVCGSIGSHSWDSDLVSDILTHELPILFLPHAASGSSPLQNTIEPLNTTGKFIGPSVSQTLPISPKVILPPWEDSPWLKSLESVLLSRTRFLPSGYQFFLLRTIRDLIPVCSSIAAQVIEEDLPVDVATHLASDMLQMTAWAMVAGVENLDWHGWGIHHGLVPEHCGGSLRGGPSPHLGKVLTAVQNGGKISRMALEQKTANLKYGEGSKALNILAMQGDMDLQTQEFSPHSLASYIEDTARRSCLPALDLLTTPYYGRMRSQHDRVEDGA